MLRKIANIAHIMALDLSKILIAGKLLCLVVFLLVIFPPLKSHAQQRTDEEIPNEFILQVLMLPDWRIAEDIFAYELNGKYYLPLEELSKGFEFFVETNAQDQYAKGFASREENTFVIEGQRGELTIDGQRESIGEDAILESEYLATDDMYVQLEILNKIWPVDMRVDLANLTVQTVAEEELSFMRRKDREDKRKQVEARAELRKKTREFLPLRENEHDYLGRPVMDYQAIYEYDNDADEFTGSNIFTGVQHVGKTVADYSANFRLEEDGEFQRPDNIRLRFTRKAQGDEDLLIPTVKSFEGGDVTIRQKNLVGTTKSGRGVAISNDNKDRGSEFDRITIEGIGPPGWDIELYNNEELIAVGTVPDDGQYFFEDVTLNFGNNNIKTLFYGPQGQVREETQSYNAGGNMLSPGEMKYQAGVLDADRDFILLDNEPRTEPRGYVKTGNVSYGLTRNVTLLGSYSEMPTQNEDKRYVTAGSAFSTPVGLMEAELYKEIGGGNAFNLNYVTSFLGFRTNLNTALFKDFESDEAGFGVNRKTSETSLQLNKNVRLFSLPLGLRLNGTHTEREIGAASSNIIFNQSYSRGGLRLNHNTNFGLTDNDLQQSSGLFNATIREGNWQFRGGLNYALYPEEDLTSANGEIRYKLEDGFQAAYNLAHNFQTSDYSTGVQLGYDFDKFLGTAEADYDSDAGFVFTVRATTSLHPYTPDGTYDFNSHSRRNYAPIKALTYLDKDADGVFDEEDEPLTGTRLEIGGGRTKEMSNEDGYLIANAPSNRRLNVSIDKRSLADPYFVPGTDGFSVYPIKGKVVEAEFPIIETGSIEGTVFRESNLRAVPGLTVNLLDENGEILMSTVTGFDGYYIFEFIKPGTYKLEADPSHGVKVEESIVELTPSELYKYGNDLLILPSRGEEELAALLAPFPKDDVVKFMLGEVYVPGDPNKGKPPEDVVDELDEAFEDEMDEEEDAFYEEDPPLETTFMPSAAPAGVEVLGDAE